MIPRVFGRMLTRGSTRGRAGVASMLLALLAAISAVAWRTGRSADWPSAVAREGPFADTLVESGTIEAARVMVYSAPVGSGPSKIVELAPEGVPVRAGDLLVRFDDTAIRQALDRERAALQLARAEAERAAQELTLEELRGREETDTASQQVARAEAALASEVQGTGPLEVARAEAAAAEAARQVAEAARRYDDIKPLLSEGFVTRAEVERAEQAWRRAQEQQRLADLALAALTRYERPAALAQSEATVASARDALARARQGAAARLAERRAAAGIARSRIAESAARVAALEVQLARTTIRAGGSGLVVFRELYFGSDRRKPQVGDEVWPNQPLVVLPDSSQPIVETRVREVDLHRASSARRVAVTVDAYPEVRLEGAIAFIGALAQDDPARAGTKYFPVTVQLQTTDPRLRTGMTARIEIQVAALARAIVIPIEAVFEDEAGSYVVVASHGRPVRRPIAIAARNDSEAAIGAGIAVGERVLLVDPLAAGRTGDRHP